MLGGRKEKLDTSQKYVDDGSGYVGPDGTRYQFIKIAVGTRHNGIWRFLTGKSVERLSEEYERTGDERYARITALILARIAKEYPRMDPDRPPCLTLEDVKKIEYKRPPRGRWASMESHLAGITQSYRAITPYLNKGGDSQLRQFLAAKGIDDVKAHIQWKLCHNLIVSVLEGHFVSGNGITGLHRVMADVALAWDMHDPSQGATTEYILQWILHDGPNSADKWMYNSFDRDGFGCTEGLGYNYRGGISHLTPLAKALEPAGVDLFAIPRYREVMRMPIKVIVGGRWVPAIGDGGNTKGTFAEILRRRVWRASLMGPPFDAYADPLLAQALANSPRDIGPYREKIKPVIEKVGKEIQWESRNFPIFGLAILESGKGEHRRGLACYYGGTTAHGHHDRLTFSVFNRRGPVTPDLGYPYISAQERYEWTNNTSSHNTVVVDARKQPNLEPGHLKMFSITPFAQALEVDGAIAYRGLVTKYTRTLVWVDVDEKNSYLVDIFRVAGGSQHDYSLHGASNQVVLDGLKLVKQQGGTLAGPDIAYRQRYDQASSYYRGSGYQYLFSVKNGRPTGGFVATWDHWEDGRPFLRVHVPKGVAEQVFFADGLPPFGKPEDALRYMFLRNGKCPPYHQQYDEKGQRTFADSRLESTFVTVLEPLHDEPFIRGVDLIREVKSLGAADVALSIRRTDGATDLVICREDRGPVQVGAIAMSGRIALCSTRGGDQPERLALLDGTRLSCRGKTISVDHPYEGKVRSVDYDAMTLTVSEKLPAGRKLSGKTIVFSTPPRSANFVIDSVESMPTGSRIRLRDLDAIIYRGNVEKASNANHTVVLSSAIEILHAGSGMAGMRLCNGDRSCDVKIKRFDRRYDPNTPWPPYGGTAHVEADHDLERAFPQSTAHKPTLAYVYEFGAGDPYYVTPAAWFERKR